MNKYTHAISEFFHVDFTEVKGEGGEKITFASLFNRAGLLLLQDRFEFWLSEEGYAVSEMAEDMLQYYHDTVV